ncbi:MAG: hypothetical protein LBJ02_00730 [Bifidobacteriaceae bacterium]|nr:hypothetical protein [Bifidobacteriaceae bacterium]
MKRITSVAMAAILICSGLAACSGEGSGSDKSGEGSNNQGTADGPEADPAAREDLLWVYLDREDGLNHFRERSFMGDNYDSVPEMDEAAEAHSGTSGIAAELDTAAHTWGGYMFLNGSPEAESDAGEANGSGTPAGVDLTGAEKLTFYAKGESGGEQVEFFTAGFGWEEGLKTAENADSADKITLGTVGLTKDWQEYEISLADADLSSIACGFAWVVTRDSNPGTGTVRFYMDDISFQFAEGSEAPR